MSERASTKGRDGPWFWCGTSLMASRRDHSETVLVTKDYPLEPTDSVKAMIAAAPDMFDALLQARDWLEGWVSAEPQLAIIEAALAKAEELGQRADANSTNPLSEGRERS